LIDYIAGNAGAEQDGSPMTTQLSRFRTKYLWITLAMMLALTYVGCRVFPESTFQLDKASRLPRWLPLPSDVARADVTVTMNYYSYPWGSRAGFLMKDHAMHSLQRTEGSTGCGQFSLKDPFRDGAPLSYPSYTAVTVDGVTEIMEHKTMEPIFSVTDDPAVWKRYEATCGIEP
jgi:hypothetical protein